MKHSTLWPLWTSFKSDEESNLLMNLFVFRVNSNPFNVINTKSIKQQMKTTVFD